MMQIDLLAGRDLLVSSHAGTRLPIAVFSSQGAPPPTGSSEQRFTLLPSWILKCQGHSESFYPRNLLHNFKQMAAFLFNILRSKDTGYHRDAVDIGSKKL